MFKTSGGGAFMEMGKLGTEEHIYVKTFLSKAGWGQWQGLIVSMPSWYFQRNVAQDAINLCCIQFFHEDILGGDAGWLECFGRWFPIGIRRPD